MLSTGFWWILLSTALYGLLHSLLAARRVKATAERWLGQARCQRFYRLFFVVVAGISFLPTFALVALLPDRIIYTILGPWKYLTMLIQLSALVGLGIGVSQTGAFAFLGISQALSGPRPEVLVKDGLYHWVRHPLYTCSLVFLWLVPTLTWNLLALNLGVSAYLWIGSIFEERKLIEQFGAEYADYRACTPRIIPLRIPTRRAG
jgi:methanethiol S-methyltransferase